MNRNLTTAVLTVLLGVAGNAAAADFNDLSGMTAAKFNDSAAQIAAPTKAVPAQAPMGYTVAQPATMDYDLLTANQNARHYITPLINHLRKSAGLPEVSEEEIFSTQFILDGKLVTVYPCFRTLGDLRQHVKMSPKVTETGTGFALGYVFSKLGEDAAPITSVKQFQKAL